MSPLFKAAMAPKEPTNSRMARLESAAQKTARMLLRRNDIDVVVGSSPRYNWKEKRLYLPAYSKEADDLRLEQAWRGLTDHECSHVEFSDFDAIERANAQVEADHGSEAVPRVMTLINIFEDIWIEREWGAMYPGAVEHFRVKNEYAVEKNGGSAVCNPAYIIPESRQPIGLWGAFVQAVLRVGRGNVKMEDVAEPVQELMRELRPEIMQGWAAGSTPQVIDVARAIYKKLEEMGTEPPPPGPGDGDGTGEPGEGEPGEGDGGSGAGDGDDEGKGGGSSPGNDEGKGKGGGGDEGDDEGKGGTGSGDGPGPGPDEHGPSTPTEEKGKGGSEPGYGAGNTSHEMRKLAVEATGGEWGEVKADAEVIASKYVADMPPLYTVHPDARARDELVTYDGSLREKGRPALARLASAAGPAAQKLTSMMSGAIAASRQSRIIGGMEEGDGLDENAIPGIAMGFNDPAIFQTTMRQIEESTFIAVLVDCSGSMGSSSPHWDCPDHKRSARGSEECRHPGCKKGGPVITSKAGYAAVTAMALHKAMQTCRVPHAVLGYSTIDRHYRSVHNPARPGKKGYLEWSRATSGLESHIFVPAPGIHDDGAAIPFITGRGCNLDGESVMWAAQYAAQHGGQYDRVILMVVADGLPAGADDYQMEGPYLKQAVDVVAHAGIEVYGIGVMIRDMSVFRAYYPERKATAQRAPTGSIEIRSKEGLTDNVLRQLTAMLTRGYGMSRRGGRR